MLVDNRLKYSYEKGRELPRKEIITPLQALTIAIEVNLPHNKGVVEESEAKVCLLTVYLGELAALLIHKGLVTEQEFVSALELDIHRIEVQ